MNFQQKILNWFHIYGRKKLPWKNQNIYLTWVSEIMLQQTRVQTVIPYFQKFKTTFPNVKTLANSSIQKVLHIWSGLGYYQRAHNLYNTAKIIKEKYNGDFPENINQLIDLPGIGKSTAGAILSFSKNFYYPILDGNIKRILIRKYNFNIQNHKKTELDKKLWNIIEKLIPIHNTGLFNQAMIDLGALVCIYKNPKCYQCPIQKICKYNKTKDNKKKILSNIKNIKKKKGILFLILKYKKYVLLQKNNHQKFWKNLYYFPSFEFNVVLSEWETVKFIKSKNILQEIPPFIHNFTHITLYIIPFVIQLTTQEGIKNNKKKWFDLYQNNEIGIPTPIQNIINKLKLITQKK